MALLNIFTRNSKSQRRYIAITSTLNVKWLGSLISFYLLLLRGGLLRNKRSLLNRKFSKIKLSKSAFTRQNAATSVFVLHCNRKKKEFYKYKHNNSNLSFEFSFIKREDKKLQIFLQFYFEQWISLTVKKSIKKYYMVLLLILYNYSI